VHSQGHCHWQLKEKTSKISDGASADIQTDMKLRAEAVTFDYRDSISISHHYCMESFNTDDGIEK